MGLPTNQEQELLQLINRFRADPAGEYGRLITSTSPPTAVLSTITSAITYFGTDLALFQAQMATLSPAAPLAWNTLLENAAAGHSAQMIEKDTQSHQVTGEAPLGDRVLAAGYDYARVGENIYAFSSSPLYAHAGFVIDWGDTPTGIQTPPGHRLNLIDSRFTEIGIDITAETNPSSQVGPLVVTQNLGTRFAYAPQLLGVVFDDADADAFYDAGEGLAGVTITAVGAPGTFQTTSWSSGGYQVALPEGSYTVTFNGPGLASEYSTKVTMGVVNVQLDAEASQFASKNATPVVTAGNLTAGFVGQSLAAATLFSAFDADGDTLYFNFWDGSSAPTSGHFLLDGAVQPTDTVIGVAAADLGKLSFVAGSTGDTLYVRASDGIATSDWAKFSVAAPPMPTLALGGDVTVSEAAVRVTIAVTLSAAPPATVTVPWSLADGTATVADKDMPAGQGGTLTFLPGGPLSQVISFLVNDEAYKDEADETLRVVLGTPTGATLARAEAVVTLTDHFMPPPAVPLALTNTTTKTASTPAPEAYTGPVSYLQGQFVHLGSDGVNVVANAPNMFLRSGSGDDALAATAGQNVLDAGTGSNFLTGGSGADTFFLDARGATVPIWSTIVDFGAGDAATVWGVSQAASSFIWEDKAGTAGFNGLTVHTTTGGGPFASLTLAGFTEADRSSGRLAVLFGNDPVSGSDYMYVFASS
jgi:hypothetical protein